MVSDMTGIWRLLLLGVPGTLACLDAGLVPASASAASTGTGDAPVIAARLVGAHNRERAALGSPRMLWSPTLAAAAAAYANALAATDRWGHSPARDRVGQGENLWMGTRGAFTPEQMVGDWASERRMFRPGTFPNVSRTGSWHDVGHYTQIVWPETREVGCAIRSSARFDYLVCRYAVPGNVLGRQITAATSAQLSMAAAPGRVASQGSGAGVSGSAPRP